MNLAIRAHAKINPLLVVGKLRQDGYHEIETIFQAVDLHDTVTISSAEETSVTCSFAELSGEANLAYKALRLCAEVYEFPPIVIHIEKLIPMQAGLGGGSSDAGAVLRLLDRVSGGALRRHIDEIALACGSDVPFFLGSSPRARGRGRGERLEPLDPLAPAGLVLAMPPSVRCSTGEAFAKLDALPMRDAVRPENVPYNDFERVAPCECVELLDRLASLGANPVGLCGSGGAVYGFTPQAQALAVTLTAEGNWAVATSTIESFGDPWTP